MTSSSIRLAQLFSQNRREFVLSGASLAILPWVSRVAAGQIAQPHFDSDPFQLGVASGDPSPDGMVLWTRLCGDPLTEDIDSAHGMGKHAFEVVWEIAKDDSMREIVQSGTTVATGTLGHSVHVEVQGLLPNRWYSYRFRCGQALSPVGRTRTAPAPTETPDRLRFAFASCQHYESGLYTAYQHMSREDLDLIVHLGDYIYEGAAQEKRTRKHIGPELTTLQQYRSRYAQYKSDLHLMAAHAQAPWLVVWDDHEFDNNCAGDISEEKGVTRESFLLRRAAAYQAYYENMPLRAVCLPKGPDMQLYRTVAFGRLANFEMLDTRQYRTDQPNGDGSKPLVGDVFHPEATLLGERQDAWLQAELGQSQATWNVLAQQIMMARVDRGPEGEPRFSMDQWAGYDKPRKRLLSFLRDHRIANPVVLTGDIHNHWVNDLMVDFDRENDPVVATEFVGTSISSGGDGTQKTNTTDAMLAKNPFVKFFNAERGYVSCTVTPKTWQSDYQVIPYVTRPGAPRLTRASFVVEAGKPGAVPS
jgi:alkaline phosphatase D